MAKLERRTALHRERRARFEGRSRLTVAITGASGLIGTALAPYLAEGGHTVRPVKRGDFSAIDGADAVVHLAGAPIGQRWSRALREEIVTSRVDYTRALVAAIRAAAKPPRVLVSGSATGIYGDRGDEVLDERSAVGQRAESGPGFLVALCSDWEAEALKAPGRVVCLRTGIVLTPRGGALAQMLPAFKLGAGGPLGNGRQWMGWMSIEDELGAIEHALFTDSLQGPVNGVAPEPCTAKQLAVELARVLGRPAFVRIPALALKVIYGESAEAAMLVSQRVKPGALLASGFRFVHPTLESCFRFELGR